MRIRKPWRIALVGAILLLSSAVSAADAGPDAAGAGSLCTMSGDGETWAGVNWGQQPPPDGNPIRHETFVGCGTQPQHCLVWSYENGRVTSQGQDDDCDGVADDACHTWTYDTLGNMTSDRQDTDCDGISDGYCTSWTYDTGGALLEETYDPLCSGEPDRCFVRTCDEDGNVTTIRDFDGACDQQGSCRAWAYSFEAENPTALYYDKNCDGAFDRCTDWHYDAQGRLTDVQEDYDCNGWTGDHGGAPGSFDECTTFTYEAAGDVVRSKYDQFCDGVSETCTTRTYDARGNLTLEQTDDGCDDSLDHCAIWSYDDEDRMVFEGGDGDCDGVAEYCRRMQFDPMGRLAGMETDEDCDGSAEVCETWTYDGEEAPIDAGAAGAGGSTDGGLDAPSTSDANANATGGASTGNDASSDLPAGSPDASGEGCGCRTGAPRGPRNMSGLVLLLLVAARMRRGRSASKMDTLR